MSLKKKLNKGSAGQNRKSSEDFILKYAHKSDVQMTGSGLLYRVIDIGGGLSPTEEDVVVVNQRILNVDGSVITDTYKTGMPDKFTVKEAIPGLREGLLLMQAGARYEFVVPADLAWGRRGVSNKIGPNAVLVFDLRLLRVEL